MGKKAAEGMNACAVLGAAFARGCAPEGAVPIEFDAAIGIPKNSAVAQRSRRGGTQGDHATLSSSLREKGMKNSVLGSLVLSALMLLAAITWLLALTLRTPPSP